MLKSKSCVVPKEFHGNRFDVVAVALFPELSRKRIKLIIDSGGAYVNKKRVQIAKFAVQQFDKLEVFWEEASSQAQGVHVKNKKTSFNSAISNEHIIFEDPRFFIINKPAGIPSQATLTSSTNTIFHMLNKLNAVKFKLADMHLVHRLDKETSGLMIVARNKAVQKLFEEMFRDKKIVKSYNALCYHYPKVNSGTILYPIVKDNSKPNAYFAVTNANSKIKNAKECETQFQVLKNYKYEACSVECFPKTGRTHQIRVHMAALGCPILGDKTYAQNIYGHRFSQIALRQMLHAKSLHFELDGEKFKFEAPFPEDFLQAQKTLEKF